jgi:hypothetical protein
MLTKGYVDDLVSKVDQINYIIKMQVYIPHTSAV